MSHYSSKRIIPILIIVIPMTSFVSLILDKTLDMRLMQLDRIDTDLMANKAYSPSTHNIHNSQYQWHRRNDQIDRALSEIMSAHHKFLHNTELAVEIITYPIDLALPHSFHFIKALILRQLVRQWEQIIIQKLMLDWPALIKRAEYRKMHSLHIKIPRVTIL